MGGNLIYEQWLFNTSISVNSTFLYVTNQTGFDWMSCDGILGLSVAGYRQFNSPLRAMKDIGIISRGIIGIYLSNVSNDTTSEIYIGGQNNEIVKNNAIFYSDVSSNSYWEVESSSRTLNGVIIATIDHQIIFDIGIPHIIIPEKDFDPIKDYLTTTMGLQCTFQNNIYRCNNGTNALNADIINKLPIINFTIGDLNYGLKGIAYSFLEADNMTVNLLLVPSASITKWVVGNCFLRNFYTLLDYDKLRVALIP